MVDEEEKLDALSLLLEGEDLSFIQSYMDFDDSEMKTLVNWFVEEEYLVAHTIH